MKRNRLRDLLVTDTSVPVRAMRMLIRGKAVVTEDLTWAPNLK